MKLPMPSNPLTALCLKLCGLATGMFVFAIWIMPPMYEVFCEITGLNGKTGGRYEAVDVRGADTSRTIRVQFVAFNNDGMPWEFGPEVRTLHVHPGEQVRIDYSAYNPTERDMVGQAIPSLTPFMAANYFHKTECFCFEQQPLTAGERAEMPMLFIVDRDIPASVNTITLSYTLFDVTDRFGSSRAAAERNSGRVAAATN
ncbi:cytochrome c oxidase assembly protein [Marinimicrobium sp. ABcell2]|uniref:cytochrome c oxidase assembly protein n=1 Tax=Marinimicrobium sp. ABcell2 TaxID=3069751 RepID=UPI0027B82F69|nr:cytochrome c oxidase assembly protein [Marinimicrobium sp. ABcell2]MDQ2076241.1 cytochrome c oxidase assembly protein [Marinimicrobium sp. ABcell2]